MTDAECRLWAILRSTQAGGLRFRRQQPIGPYIVDFFCSAAKLVIELDGDQHGADRKVLYDEVRTQRLEAAGYRVLRFPNAEVFRSPQRVLDAVAHVIKEYGIPLLEIRAANFDPPSRGG
jgi:very-short-patch-repair endonuclease